MVREGHSPGLFNRAGHSAPDGVIAVIPHLGHRLPRGRVVEAIRHDHESFYARLYRLALCDQRVQFVIIFGGGKASLNLAELSVQRV
jgi:hypothetical protein